MAFWQDYAAWATPQAQAEPHTVSGTLKVLPRLWSPQLENWRDILVYLPPGYGQSQARYPVLYMHDGQNLFDQATSYAGEWQVDETMEMLSGEGREAIVVGIPNMGELRVDEYTPFPDERGGGGRGDSYVTFIVETVKPLIDAGYRTRADAAHTGVAGSSLGGLISLYALFRFPDVFGLCGALSPALAGAGGRIFDYVEKADRAPARVYMDVGTREATGIMENAQEAEEFSRGYLEDVRRMYRLLIEKGYRTGADLLYVEDEGAIHHESAWARRLPAALRFLLAEAPA